MRSDKKEKKEETTIGEICDNYSEIINKLCSANYLIISKTPKTESNAALAKKNWPVKNPGSEGFIRDSYFWEVAKKLRLVYKKVFEEHDKAKDELVSLLNRFYKRNYIFEDYFDGADVIDQKYFSDSINFCRDELETGSYEDFAKILIAHADFNKKLEDMLKYEAVVEIFNAMAMFSSSGENCWFNDTDSKPSVIGIIDEQEILKLYTDLYDCHMEMLQEFEETSKYSSLYRRQGLDSGALDITEMFVGRLAATNTPYDKKTNMQTKKLVDVLSSMGENVIDPNYEYHKTYYSLSEIYMLRQALNDMCCDPLFEKILKERGTLDLMQGLLIRAGGNTMPRVYYRSLNNLARVNEHYFKRLENDILNKKFFSKPLISSLFE